MCERTIVSVDARSINQTTHVRRHKLLEIIEKSTVQVSSISLAELNRWMSFIGRIIYINSDAIVGEYVLKDIQLNLIDANRSLAIFVGRDKYEHEILLTDILDYDCKIEIRQ